MARASGRRRRTTGNKPTQTGPQSSRTFKANKFRVSTSFKKPLPKKSGSVSRVSPRTRKTTSPAVQNVRKTFDPTPKFDSPFIRQIRQSGQDTRRGIFNLGQQTRRSFDAGELNPIKIIQDTSQRNATEKARLKAAGKLPAQQNKARLEKAKAEGRSAAFDIDDIFGSFL